MTNMKDIVFIEFGKLGILFHLSINFERIKLSTYPQFDTTYAYEWS